MRPADLARLQLAYDHWATQRLLAKTDGLVEQAGGSGARWETIEGSLRHVLGSHTTWLGRWTGAPPEPVEGTGFDALGEAAERIHQLLEAFVAPLTDDDCERFVDFTDSRGNPHHENLGVLITHAVNHGTYHRGEAAAMLTRLGRSPGDLDLVVYRRITVPGT